MRCRYDSAEQALRKSWLMMGDRDGALLQAIKDVASKSVFARWV